MFAIRWLNSEGTFALYWWHDNDQFTYAEGPRTLYPTKAEAEGGIIWIIGRKGPIYIGELEVVRA